MRRRKKRQRSELKNNLATLNRYLKQFSRLLKTRDSSDQWIRGTAATLIMVDRSCQAILASAPPPALIGPVTDIQVGIRQFVSSMDNSDYLNSFRACRMIQKAGKAIGEISWQ